MNVFNRSSIYNAPSIYTIYNAPSIYKIGDRYVNPKKSFVLNIDELDLINQKQGDLQFYGTGTKIKVDNKLRLIGACSFTRPLEDSLDYYFEIEFSITNLQNWLYISGRTFIQAGSYYPPYGICFTSPYENLNIKSGLTNDVKWKSWGYTNIRYVTTHSPIQNVKFSERCNGRHYVQCINKEVFLEFDTLIDYPNLAGDANYNTTTGDGLNKIGVIISNGEIDIISMKFERYD